jgi:hypothetical protein
MIAVILVVALAAVLIFLVYSILRVAFKTQEKPKNEIIPYKATFDEGFHEEAASQRQTEVHAAEQGNTNQNNSDIVEQSTAEGAAQYNEVPEVPGQTTEELQAPEPLQQRVSTKVEQNSASDPYESNDNTAMFGSNLRHPEAAIEPTGGNFGSLENEIVAGLASQVSKPTDIDKVQFSAEMAQNGGEFMSGIFAYDAGEGGNNFSSL